MTLRDTSICLIPVIIAMITACDNSDGKRKSAAQTAPEEQAMPDSPGTMAAEKPARPLSQQPEINAAAQMVQAPPTANEFADLPAPYTFADYNRGRRVFKLCQSCHSIQQGGPNLVGPNLYGVFNRQIGMVDAFVYSKAARAANFAWTPEKLDEWLTSPRAFLPGNKMSFAGVRKPEDRTAVIAYIMKESGYTDQ